MIRVIAFLLYFLVTTSIGAFATTRVTRDQNRTLKWIARRLGGTHEPERRDFSGAVTWTLDASAATLHFTEERGGVNGVALRIRKACTFRVRVFPETGWARVRRFLGSQDVQIGHPLFDRTFVVQANFERNARLVLTRDARASLVTLASVAPVSLDLGPRGIVLRTPHVFRNELDRLTRFAGEALTLGRALLQVLDPSVRMAEMESQEASLCPVCSTPVVEDRVLCARCRTPHHKDCWTYLGGCAMFACAGRPDRMRVLPARRPAA